MGKIVLLDDLTINQIAAGEVIERPASVVKELVENSIDAGAKNVTVEIKNGGISYIRVTDDGSGIMPDDMEIAFERHATSKIRKAADLDDVKSMGFRGEALASIASIAKVELVSKTADSDIGYKIEAVGGDITDKHEEGAQKGTSITVKELFFNTPVRYKFLKKDFTEAGYIEEKLTHIALANPEVAIKLINNGKTLIQTNGSGKLVDVIYSLFGKEVTQNILAVDYEYEEMHVTGVVGKPLLNRSNRTNQIFFVNKRCVKDKVLTSATEQAFKGLTMIGKHPFAILNIDMNPKLVDVNVHPTKLEIRFQEEQKVFKAIYHSIKETLLKGDLVSDPVKEYDSEKDDVKDFSKGLTNKDRLEAWSLKKEEPKQEKIAEVKPNFNEFKSTIDKLEDSDKKDFMTKIASAKTTEEIIESVKQFSNFVKEGSDSVDSDKKEEKDKVVDEVKEENEEYKPAINGLSAEDLKQINEDTMDDVEIKGDINLMPDISEDDEVKEEAEKVEEEKVEENEDFGNIDISARIAEKMEETANENGPTKYLGVEENGVIKVSEIEDKEEPELSFEEMYKKMFGRDILEAKKEYDEKNKQDEGMITPIKDNEISLFEKQDSELPPYKFVGIAFRTYILLTMNDEMYFMDQHAAHERILYEKVKKNFNSNGVKDSQMMLLPDIINLNSREMSIYKENKELFSKAGFIAEEFGENTVKLTGVPEFCLNFNTKEIFLETLDEIDTVARTAKQEIEDKFLATVACKAAVKAHMALTKEEVDSLIAQLIKLPNPFSCPHGRPTIIKMTKDDIEKKFHRKL